MVRVHVCVDRVIHELFMLTKISVQEGGLVHTCLERENWPEPQRAK